jgi:hypothetical protein
VLVIHVKSRLFCFFMVWCALPMYTKKHLGFTGLRKLLSKRFSRIVDHRDKEKVNHCMHDVFMSAYAIDVLPGCLAA